MYLCVPGGEVGEGGGWGDIRLLVYSSLKLTQCSGVDAFL